MRAVENDFDGTRMTIPRARDATGQGGDGGAFVRVHAGRGRCSCVQARRVQTRAITVTTRDHPFPIFAGSHHSPGGCTGDCESVTCSFIVGWQQMDSWLGQFGTQHDDDEAFRRGEHMGRVGSHPACNVPFPPRRSGEYRKGMIPARPFGVWGSVWDSEPSRERVGDWGGLATALLCVAETRATRPNGEWGYSTRRHMLGPERPEAVLPTRGGCTYRPSVTS